MGMCASSCCVSGADVMTAAGLGLPKNFTVIKALGMGQEGKTYLAQERTPKGTMLYALKAIPRGHLLRPDLVLRGLRNQSSLCFEHVVKFLEILLTPTHLIIKFEYVDGGDLFKYVCRQRFVRDRQLMDEEHARFLFIQILCALHHCHEHRVAHRDIKFANILCTRSRNPIIKVCDFGLSKGWIDPQETRSHSAVGTLMFMSPEVVSARTATSNNSKPYDITKSDVWGLGVVLYTMLFGHFPFLSPESAEMQFSRTQILSGNSASTFSFLLKNMEMAHRLNPQRLTDEIQKSDLTRCAKHLLLSMLAMDEEKRIGLDQIAKHDWITGYGLSLCHAAVIARVRWDKGRSKTGCCHYAHGELLPGSPADRELEAIVRRATRLGHVHEQLVRWLPPGVRLRPDMSPTELAALEEQGIRRCSKCPGDPEDKYSPLCAVGLRVMGRN